MRVLGFDPQITVQRAWQLSSGVEQALSLDDLFSRCDMVTVHVPLLDATRGLVNAARLRLMKDNGVILNFSRAGIVDESAVVEALDAGKLQRLHLRLSDQPAQGPSESRGPAAPRRVHRRGGGELRASWWRTRCGTSWRTATCAIRSTSPRRSCRAPRMRRGWSIANENVPNMVGQISTALAAAKLNIADLLNKSRGELAYTLIDSTAPCRGRCRTAAKIEGVLTVRAL